MLDELHHDPVRPSQMSAGTLLTTPALPVRVQAHDSVSEWGIEAERWKLRIGKASSDLELTNKQTGQSWQIGSPVDNDGGTAWAQTAAGPVVSKLEKIRYLDQSGTVWRLQSSGHSNSPVAVEIAVLSPSIIRFSVRAPESYNNFCLRFRFHARGPFFGLGERFDRTKLDGLKTTLQPEDLLGQPGHNWTYIPIPLLYTTRGLGVYLDAAPESAFDLSEASQDKVSVQLKGPSADLYFFIGNPKQIIEAYTSLTGRSPVPPPWTFGVWICAYQSPQRVLEEARRLKGNHIPANAIWTFDVMGKGDIMGWPLWWTGYYPDRSKFTAQLHQLGFKALTYVHPYLRSVLDPYNLPNPAFEEGLRNGLFVLNAQGQPAGPGFEQYLDENVDFTRPANVDWWEEKIRAILIDDGFDGWMEDFGEWIKETDRFAAGVTGHLMANLNPLFYHKITYEISHRAKPDAVEFARSGYAGSQGYTQVVWGGDQFPTWDRDYGLPSVVNAGMTAGLSGFSTWAPDIASNGHSVELWTRWVEFGALTPIMRNHIWDKPEGSVNLWYSPQTTELFRRYARLHTSLLPYLQTFAREAAQTGVPIMRHPMLEYPDDEKTADCIAEYFLGEKILVAPVVEQGATRRSLYLPSGSWVDYWTQGILEGGREVNVSAPLERIPIFIRAGSILPFTESENDTLAWRVFPTTERSPGTFTLYDNTVARVNYDTSGTEVRVLHSPQSRRLAVTIPAPGRPRSVNLGGVPLSEIEGANGDGDKSGWYMDGETKSIRVVFRAQDFDLRVTQ